MRDMEWFVINEKSSWSRSDTCCQTEVINIFDHCRFSDDVKKAYKLYKNDFTQFAEQIRKELSYYFEGDRNYETLWEKRDNEIHITELSWDSKKQVRILDLKDEHNRRLCEGLGLVEGKARKIDVYSQVMCEWDDFIKYVWAQTHARKLKEAATDELDSISSKGL